MNNLDLIPLASGRSDFVSEWGRVCREAHEREVAWVARLRAQGVRAAHPDDGWVNREKNEVHFAYPTFIDGVTIGSVVALGTADEFRLVEIIGEREGLLKYWIFRPVKKPWWRRSK